MKEYKFKSVFAPHINSFLRMKEAMGFGLDGFKIRLKEFDLFFIENNVTDLSITKSLISEWSKTRVNDSRRTLYDKYSVISQFCKYMCNNPGSLLNEYLKKGTVYKTDNRVKRKLNSDIIAIIDNCIAENEVKRLDGRIKQQLKRIDIDEKILTAGHSISYSVICDYIKTKLSKFKEGFIRQGYKEGSCCEFDWAEVKLNVDVYDKGNSIQVNKSLYELESFLVNLRKEEGANERIDTTIEAPNILLTFEKSSVANAYTPNDYQYYLLHHLAMEYHPDKSLYNLIDSFVEKYKTGFSRSDIIITNIGATRCKTNIRFALNNLRYWGLVINHDEKKKRSWSPSLLGLVTLLNISNLVSHLFPARKYLEMRNVFINLTLFRI